MALDKRPKVKEEADCLLSVGFIKLVEYLKWVSNIVAFLKKNGQIIVCIDFPNLNKAFPIHSHPLL